MNRLFGTSKSIQTRILFGGSVRPENAAELARASEINDLLVGGASLNAEEFLRIISKFA